MAGTHLSIFRTNLSRPSTSPAPSSHHRSPITARVAQNLSYWDSIHSDIDSHLKKSIQIRQPTTVFEPMHHLTFSAPKTAASALCVAACELVGGVREDAIVAASAIHLVHAAAYTHDHLRLTTDRVWSDPRPEIPHLYGSNIELLTGDGIMPFAFELLAQSMDPAGKNSDELLRVIIEITRAVGAEGMVAGEGYEVEFDLLNSQPARRLHGCGAACGAILGGGNEEEIGRLKRCGEYVGKIQGLLSQMDKVEGGKLELVEKWRGLALKELEYFDSRKIEQISTIFGV
ncbi:heterodimeric geranylgeranyl pyrophosphate synthase small subunit, chloroplastic-like [Cynara cardunculus var. scolymus]|uniref:heterodimeric geranylgeranyl pyrophosphate synthase small subunit, chloroplastic-like n=1 Tax=Cynara cardunculus var. scolymus TaxID=59895 RepID=UPI000D629754|nr:heterodimeric geranylgeranyl pyrophosphate synthase small subunit, chloroplastic-like [Cynara cardunculus var. scolymus]